MRDCRILVILAIVMAPMGSRGQDRPATISPQFGGILQAPQHRQAVLAAAKQSIVWTSHDCKSGVFESLPTVRIWKQPKFDNDGKPLEGVWGETVEANGCGLTRTLNVMTLVRSAGVLVSQTLVPGDTKADPVLQRDAARYVFAASMVKAPGCRKAFIDDTKIVGQEREPGANTTASAKVEDWTVSACGHYITVEVKFVSSAGGTDIIARAL